MNPRPKRARRLRTSSSGSSNSSGSNRQCRRRKRAASANTPKASSTPPSTLTKHWNLRPKAPPKDKKSEKATGPVTRSHNTATSCHSSEPNILTSSSESSIPSTPTTFDPEYKASISSLLKVTKTARNSIAGRVHKERLQKQSETAEKPVAMTVVTSNFARRQPLTAAEARSGSRVRKRRASSKKDKGLSTDEEKDSMEIEAFSGMNCDSSFLEESLLCLGSDDEFEDERLLDEAFLKKCGRRVMEVYNKVKKDYDDRIANEEAPTFAKNVSQLPIRLYHTYDDSTPTPLDLERDDLSEFISHFKTTDCRSMNAQRCGVRFLPALELRPRTAYWVHTECNIRADEEHRLSHIPFVSEDHDDKQFCAELRKLYDEGIHGADRGCDKYINDYIMFQMLEVLKNDWEDRSNAEKIMDHIYYAIFKLFPNKLSHRQLVTARGDLEERFAPGRTPSKSTQELKSRIDQNFHSVNVLCCERCYQYDCVLHGPYDEEIKPFKRRQGERAPRPTPCGPNCHLLEPTAEQSGTNGTAGKPAAPKTPTSPRNRKSVTSTGTPLAPPNGRNGKVAPYSNPTLMNILVSLLAGEKTSICLITAQMKMICEDVGAEPKTCREIFQLASQLAQANPSLTPEQKKVSIKDKHRSFRSFTWADGKGQVENKERMIPCSHNGHCDGNPLCVCSSGSGICSKFCGCPQDCRMRFPGCRCAPGNCRTKQCQCYFARWECDPDLCKSCKCDDLSMDGEKCRNVPLQRGHQKLLKVGISGIAGWGCFIQETADKGDLIAEYTGEVISKWESERRGLIYDKFCTSYIFGMNNDQFIDATRVGNLIRFANHSNTNANCSSEIKIVNGEHRIGVYASRHILFGEELLFDYNYGQTWNKFVPIEKSIRAQANRSTPDSDSSRTGISQNKPEKLRRSVLKKTVKGEPRLSEGGKSDPAKHDDGSHKNGKPKMKVHVHKKV